MYITKERQVFAILSIQNVHKSFGKTEVLKGVDFQVEQGQVIAIIGPSGSGKTTLLRCISFLERVNRGTMLFDGVEYNMHTVHGKQVRSIRQKMGFVFQGFNLLPKMSLLDNVALPLIYAGIDKKMRQERAMKLLKKVGLEKHWHHLPSQISGGQQQRVAIARALAVQPKLILADEPTGNLDSHTSVEIMQLFQELNDTQNITIVLVTHEPDIATYAKRQVRFFDGQIVGDVVSQQVKAIAK